MNKIKKLKSKKKKEEIFFVKDQNFTLLPIEYSIFESKCSNINMPCSIHACLP
jgi:hypothetical protein